MHRQDKSTAEKHAKLLRELVKKHENKVCADCKRNDPRWASWNLGVFICIRCSGIHRGMGTHISKVKSVDLDTWTPEQMQSIQRWGNRRANLYWEAHLRQGHVPPEHKMESFIRSKYELRRWALEGPVPSDPSVLESASNDNETAQAQPSQDQQTPAGRSQVSSRPQIVRTPPSSYATRRLLSDSLIQTQPRTLISDSQPLLLEQRQETTRPSSSAANELFALDFQTPSAPASESSIAEKKGVKQGILSLYSNAQPAAQQAPPSQANSLHWNSAYLGVQKPQAVVTGHTHSSNATSDWSSSPGWDKSTVFTSQNVWNTPSSVSTQQQQVDAFAAASNGLSDVWATSTPTVPEGDPEGSSFGSGFSTTLTPNQQSKTSTNDDAFGDIWGSFR